MDERIDAFLKDVQELEGVPASAIRDGVRSYLAVYENLVCDTEPDPKNRGEAARDWRKVCPRRVAEEIVKNAGMPAGEHWKVVLNVIDSASGSSLQS
jgi:hypothetical protein